EKLEFRCKNAEENSVLMAGTSKVLIHNGKIMGIIITVNVVTERCKIEQALKESEDTKHYSKRP
ncbi:MAG: hypothetical protein N3E52_05965, partial [Candidatus Bathyarchaeota archaeon]|nr:hypothetical protein [Candidatus Bathyarchaeota archaeon]